MHVVLFLGSAEPAGDGMGYGFDKHVYNVLRKHCSFRIMYISSDVWMKWKPCEYRHHMHDVDVVLVWASLQDVTGSFAVSFSAHTQW